MGITGQVGGAVARALLRNGKRLRGIVRDKSRAAHWAALGVELVAAELPRTRLASRKRHFSGAEAVFAMIPPAFAPASGFSGRAGADRRPASSPRRRSPKPGGHTLVHRCAARPWVGTHHPVAHAGKGTQHASRGECLRPTGMVPGKLPLGRPPGARARAHRRLSYPARSPVSDGRHRRHRRTHRHDPPGAMEQSAPFGIGRAAPLFTDRCCRYLRPTARQAGRCPCQFSGTNGRQATFEAQGTPPGRTAARIEMLDGFNSGWIEFERGRTEYSQGRRTMEEVFRELLQRA